MSFYNQAPTDLSRIEPRPTRCALERFGRGRKFFREKI